MTVPEERRRSRRVRTWFEVLHGSAPVEGVAMLRDVSSGGARLEDASARPAPGASVRVYVRIPDRRQPLELAGRVVRHTDTGFTIEYEKANYELARLLEEIELPDYSEAQEIAAVAAATSGTPAQQVREFPVYCYSDREWISGAICALPRRALVDQLNLPEPFLRVQNAMLRGEPLDFLALRSDAVAVVVPATPGAGIDREEQVGHFASHRVTCLLRGGTIRGTLKVRDKLRVSDHLMRAQSFLALRECQLTLRGDSNDCPAPERVAIALVNTRRVLGVADSPTEPAGPTD